jgi:Holliday junction resolvase RusA-like endonuclease
VDVRAHRVHAAPTRSRESGRTLSARGLRSPHPGRKPDADNILKTIDALVAVAAVPDDRLLIDARVVKRWADAGEARLVIRVEAA